jgi:tRNA (cmo5U34)-methyltransferase
VTKDAAENATPHKAAEYDRKVRETIPFYEAIHREIIDLIKTVKPDAAWWLDTGCGTGYLVELALAEFPQTHFILVDPAEMMLGQAKKRFEAEREPRLRFLEPTGSEDLAGQVGDAPFQVVTAILCHHYLGLAERRRAVQACYDVLEDQGLFVTVENVALRTERGIQIGLERWKRYQMRMGRPETVVDGHLKRFGTKYFPITVDDHIQLLTEVGFQAVEMFWLSQMQAGFYGIK